MESAPAPATRTMPRRLLAALVPLALAVLVAVVAMPTTALALTTNKATARPNQQGGNGVVGGVATRLTWEGTVDEGEEVTSVTITLPDDASFDESTTRVTVLEGLNRLSIDSTATPAGDSITIDFAEPIASGSLLRLEITNMTFPSEGGSYVVSGSYENAAGEQALPDSPAINVISSTPLQRIVAWLDAQPWVAAWNSNQFLGMFFKPQLLVTSMVSLFNGWLICLGIVVAAYPFAILIGLMFAFMKMSKNVLLRAIAAVYINILRGTPLFLQIYVMFFGLPMMGININNNILGIIVIAINASAYLAEIFRAGIESIPRGQYEAASSLGMNRAATMFWIILPQTIRRVLPTVTSDFITNYKDTSLLSSVGVMELMMFAKNAVTVAGNITPYMAAAVFYLIVTLPLIRLVTIVERRLAASESGGAPRPKNQAINTAAAVAGTAAISGGESNAI